MKIYFSLMLIGLLGLLYSMIFGDHDSDLADGSLDAGDSIDGSPSIFSSKVIFAFLMAFGVGGSAVLLGGGNILVQIFVGVGAGIVTGAFAWWVLKILYGMQGSSTVDSDSFIGKKGDIVIGTTENGKAKVRLNTLSGSNEFLCKEIDGDDLEIGDVVEIAEKFGTLLLVKKA